MSLGNSPRSQIVLQLQARKSFALDLFITDQNENPLDIADSTFTIVVRKKTPAAVSDDSGNLVTNSLALLVAPIVGHAQFNLQASDLDFAPGEYQFAIVLIEAGYSSVIVQGTLQLEQNTEFSSLGETYTPGQAPTALRVAMRGQTALYVRTGAVQAPGEVTFTSDMKDRILAIYAGQQVDGGLLTADDVADGFDNVMMTIEERAKLTSLSNDYDDLDNKPAFGDIVTRDAADFLEPEQVAASDVTSGVLNNARVPRVVDLRGVSVITSAPPSGNPGQIYLRYTP